MNHAYCTDCGTKMKKEMAEENENWEQFEDGWKCAHCNPNSDVSW